MKCLICTFEISYVEQIFQHYVDFHKIESKNYYLKALIEKDTNCSIRQTCDVCGEFFSKTGILKTIIL